MNDCSCTVNEPACWYAIATKPRQEDRAVENLTAWGIPTLAPKLNTRRDGKRLPSLFPGYIFARFEMGSLGHKVRFTRGISYIVSFGGKPAEVDVGIISSIRSRIGVDGTVALGQSLNHGDHVVIASGLLRNFEGVFEEELSDCDRVRVLLSTVSYTAHIETSKQLLQKQSDRPFERYA
jgi:transcriptional antiterminator RfaH